MTAEEDFHDLLDQLQDQLDGPHDDATDDDPHGGCWQPHRGADGDYYYYDCDGRPI